MTRNKVFISYSHKDKKIFQEFQIALRPLISHGLIDEWNDQKIEASSEWETEIQKAMDEASVALLLVSQGFLASDFISKVELPYFLKAHRAKQVKICWVLLENCRYELTQLPRIQAAHDKRQPLSEMSRSERIKTINSISEVVEKLYVAASQPRKESTVSAESPASPAVYMCFAREDERTARRLQNDFRARRIPVINEQADQPSLETEQSIRRSEVVLALFSNAANATPGFRSKLLFALEETKKEIVPVIVESGVTVMPELYGRKQFDITVGNLDELASSLQKLVQPARPVPGPAKKNGARAAAPDTANPFLVRSSVPPEFFSGRKDILRLINEHVGNYYSMQSLSIVSNRRMGKTSLLRYIEAKSKTLFDSGHRYVPVYIDAMEGSTHSLSGFMSIVRRTLQEQHKLSAWKDKHDGQIEAFGEAVHRIAQGKKIRLVLLLDEWEAIMAYPELDTTLLNTLRSFGSRAQMAMITATAHELARLEVDGKLTSNFSNIFTPQPLGNFSRTESDELVLQAFTRSRRQATDFETKLVFELAGGHPMLTQMAGSILWKAAGKNQDRKALTQEFKSAAKDTFFGLLHRMPEPQVELTRRLLNLKTRAKIPGSTYDDMILRGILTEDREFFSSCFAEYARENLG